jgi:tRNA G18 (ribose-2'-O)-methylase SpoU
MDQLNRKSIEEFIGSKKIPVVVVLDNVRSMHNVGSVFRTADAFLMESIYLCGYTPKPPHREIHKTALGATETVAWRHVDDPVEALKQLKGDGYRIIAIEQARESMPLQKFVFGEGEKLAVIFGNEVSGIGEALLAICDYCIEIPQWGMKHSLNISVAAGIVIWDLFRQKLPG